MPLGSAAPAAQAGKGANQKFYCKDTCCLKLEPSIIGTICRTPYDTEAQQPVTDFQVYLYTAVPAMVIKSFVTTGTPPKGYYYVVFVETSHGSALVHEKDLQLIGRFFELADTVKRNLGDSMNGTIVGSTGKYTLEPVAYCPDDPSTGELLPVQFTQKPHGAFASSEASGTGPHLLYDVPQSELRPDVSFGPADHIIYKQMMGLIERIDRDVVLLLPNLKVVSPLDASALEVPVYGSPKTAPSPPDVQQRETADGKTVWTTDACHLAVGQVVYTEMSNLNRSDRPPGSPESMVQAYVLATPAEDIHIHWLCPNIFSPTSQEPTSDYEVWRESSLQEKALKCDFTSLSSQVCTADESLFDIGCRVRFRDPVSAEAKYPGCEQIPSHHTFGHDLNVYRIVSFKTEVDVLWQDGSRTTETDTSLQPSDADYYKELRPGDLVALKDGISTVSKTDTFNTDVVRGKHLDFFKDTLRIRKLGVVQSVDSGERMAFVRWYQDPNVELIHGGDKLHPDSSTGPLGDTINKMSVYELNTYNGLRRHLNEMVIFAPASIEESAWSSVPHVQKRRSKTLSPHQLRFVCPDAYSETSMYLFWMKRAIMRTEWFRETTTIRPPLRRSYSINKDDAIPPNEFFGKIIAIDINGNITVRVPNVKGCRDIQLPLEKLMLKITIPPLDMLDTTPDPSAMSSSSDEASPDIEDSDDDSTSGDDSDDSCHDELNNIDEPPVNSRDVEALQNEMETEFAKVYLGGLQAPRDTEATTDGTSTSLAPIIGLPPILCHPALSSSPPAFAVLDNDPPSDHHYLGDNNLGSSPLRMKRIRKEFEILSSSLPPEIFVRSWESRMDLLRVMIVGPEGTPYEYAPFVFDLQLHEDYPNEPPSAFFHSWTSGQGPVNPNLYDSGRICLSILGTWPTLNPEESWIPGSSTVLQILVSIMGLVLVKNPFYNEAGYAGLALADQRHVESSQYTERAFLLTRKFILHALEHPIHGLEDVLAWHYVPGKETTRPQLLCKAIKEAQKMIGHHNRTPQSTTAPHASDFCSRLTKGAVAMLHKDLDALEYLEKGIITNIDS